LGRDATLTGRTEIWEFGIDYFTKHPLLGGGFDVFFDENSKSPANILWVLMEYYAAPSFHNGYIQILAEAGILGAVPFLLLLFSNLYLAIKFRHTALISIVLICVFANTGAAILIKPNAFFFVFLIYCIFLFRKNLKLVKH
jgi:exopolysaccharide production protein ExoQ